jgi:outer membrane protein TolC
VALLQGRNAVREGIRLLSTLADTDRVVVPRPDSLPALDAVAAPPSVEDLYQEALRRAPELAQAQAKIEALQAEADLRRSSRLPRLDGLVYAADALAGTGATKDWTVGARIDFEWSLPNGAERAKYRTALLDLEAAKVRREASEKEIRRQIERIVDASNSARRKLALMVDLAILQRKRLAAAEVSFEVGATSPMDLQEVRAEWMNAVTSSWQALAEAKSLEADLETRTGIGPARQGWLWEER